MNTKVEKRIQVSVPVNTAYNQWTQFEEFPHFMGGVKSVKQLSDDRLEWVAEIAGVRRQWEARILEQIPDRKVAWAATSGATNAGSVTFEDLGGGQTSVVLVLEYEPEGLVESVGDKLNVVERQAEKDLERFKSFIEDEGYASGAWRGRVGTEGSVGTPGVDDAAASRGDSGKAGVSGKLAAGVGVAAAAAVGAAAATRGKETDDTSPVQDTGEATRTGAVGSGQLPPTGTSGSAFPPAGMASGTTVTAGEPLADRAATHPFDQTNGLVDVEGDSDGTAASDTRSAAEREEKSDKGPGTIPPNLAAGNTGQ
ncbi:carbon monoxide dehydrogenase subunit G [Arthrobacter sp. V4I6]|uniref:SRPBCC family protein n=1 Tax=unclassified Arthrobacter TaxID=235627 RepID=UPI00277D9C43|nr:MULTISPECIES: SRPBCC family protein [unclassified Arthrobacter]MDQ0820429.1 carbon monoxide dehydrogenase subunit G [Arthrobacter sp. V1I7]MDQ0854609.1 carbon monoxide dehydrogenase subunit G [Arthrobacter sp. V4I6]